MEVNHFNIACCEPSLGNHFFKNIPFINANGVENLTTGITGSVTFYEHDSPTIPNVGKFTLNTPYPLNLSNFGASGWEYRDLWGVCNELSEPASISPFIGCKFYSRLVESIKNLAFADVVEDCQIAIDKVINFGDSTSSPMDNSGRTPWAINPSIFYFREIVNLGTSAFSNRDGITVIHLSENQKTINWIGSTSSPKLFDVISGPIPLSKNITIYMTTELAADPYMSSCLSASSWVNLITY